MRNVWGPNISKKLNGEIRRPKKIYVGRVNLLKYIFMCKKFFMYSNRDKITLCVGPNIPKRTKRRNVNDPQRSLLGGLKVFEKSSTSAGQFPLTLLTSAIWAGRSIETHGFFLV